MNNLPSLTPLITDELLTPCQEIASQDVDRHPLSKSDAIAAIAGEYSTAENQNYTARILAARGIAGVVRRTFRFLSDSASRPELSAETIIEGKTNCHGYTAITSELLRDAGVPHNVAFVNGHSFILLSDGDENSMGNSFMIDTPVSQLYMPVDNMIYGVSANPDYPSRGKVAWIDTSNIISLSDFTKEDHDKERAQRPWLEADTNTHRYLHATDNAEKKHRERNKLIIRYYPPVIGQTAIRAYSNLSHNIEYEKPSDKSTLRAYTHMQYLDGLYPDIDRRNKLFGATELVKRLGQIAHVDEALTTITCVKNSIEGMSDDLFLKLWPIDQKRVVAKITHDIKLLGNSVEEYESLLTERQKYGKSTNPLTSKLRMATEELKKY